MAAIKSGLHSKKALSRAPAPAAAARAACRCPALPLAPPARPHTSLHTWLPAPLVMHPAHLRMHTWGQQCMVIAARLGRELQGGACRTSWLQDGQHGPTPNSMCGKHSSTHKLHTARNRLHSVRGSAPSSSCRFLYRSCSSWKRCLQYFTSDATCKGKREVKRAKKRCEKDARWQEWC